MISLTTMTATSALMHAQVETPQAPHTNLQPIHRSYSLRDVATVVVLVLVLAGGLAAAMSAPVAVSAGSVVSKAS